MSNPALAEAKPTARSRVSNGKALFIDADRRTKPARRFRDVLAAIVSDLGGADRLSEGQKQLARRCSLLAVECELIEADAVQGKDIDLEAYGVMTDRLGRAFQRLGLKRVPRDLTPAIDDYLATMARRASDLPTDGDPDEVASD
jgi:hypothetical protein